MFTRIATVLFSLAAIGAVLPASAYKERSYTKPKMPFMPADGQTKIEIGAFCLDKADGLAVLAAISRSDLAAYRDLVKPGSKTTCIDTAVSGGGEVVEAYVEKVEALASVGNKTFLLVRVRSLSGKSVAYAWMVSRNVDA